MRTRTQTQMHTACTYTHMHMRTQIRTADAYMNTYVYATQVMLSRFPSIHLHVHKYTLQTRVKRHTHYRHVCGDIRKCNPANAISLFFHLISLFIHPSTRLSVCLSVCLSVYAFVCLSICRSTYIYTSSCLCVCVSVRVRVRVLCVYVCPSTHAREIST